MGVFYQYGWCNPDKIESCVSLDYRLNTESVPVPTAKFNVAKAWADCYKIDFYLAGVMCLLVVTYICGKHSHTLKYLIYGEYAEIEEDVSCFRWYSYFCTNFILGLLLCGNLFSLTYMLMHNGNETNDCARVLPMTYNLSILKAAPQYLLGTILLIMKGVFTNCAFFRRRMQNHLY